MEIRRVEWIDSTGRGSWTTLKELRAIRPDLIISIGFVLCEDEDYLTLVQSYSMRDETQNADDVGDNSICIPKFAISNSHTLSVSDAPVL